jgi:Zn-dependent protease with chaperone function
VDFYSAQAAARRRSGWLVLALLASVALVVAALTLVTVLVFAADGSTEAVAGIATSAALLWLLIILGASAYKGLVLRGGGGVVARALGGTRVDRDVSDPLLRRLRNVVEEMAIASGVPVPEVYVLEGEAGLNAFAAGHSPANAAVAVTRGTVERLSRDELQGVRFRGPFHPARDAAPQPRGGRADRTGRGDVRAGLPRPVPRQADPGGGIAPARVAGRCLGRAVHA